MTTTIAATAETPLLPPPAQSRAASQASSPAKSPTTAPAATGPASALKPTGGLTPEKRGYLYMVLSAVGFATASVLARAAQAAYALPSAGALQTRGALQAATMALLFPLVAPAAARDLLRLPRGVAALLAARGAVGAAVLHLSFVALRLLPAGDAAAVFFTVPLFALAFGALALGEAVTPWDALAAALSLAGVALVAAPWRHADPASAAAAAAADAEGTRRVLGTACMAAAACLSGVAVTLVRKIGTRVHVLASVLSQGVFAAAMAAALGGVQAVVQADGRARAAMFASAACAVAAQVAMDRGMQLARVGAGMLVGNVEVPMTYVVGVIGLGETPAVMQMCGAGLVVAAGMVLGWQKV